METPKFSFLVIISLVILCFSRRASSQGSNDFLNCLYNHSPKILDVVYAPYNSSYLSVFQSSIRNLRFSYPTPKPQFIVTPIDEYEIQAVVHCAKENDLQIRTRSGGHDYEGLSYRTAFHEIPFVVLDLQNMSNIVVDVETCTAWVQTGATLGQLYYRIAQKSQTLAFPAGVCPTVGVGGHISGGGFGYLLRKYGLAADNVIDASLVDVNGSLLDRKSMGEDLFWAIRGGGGASFGVITAWKLQLVPVPEKVTVFSVDKNLAQNAIELFHKWQYIAPDLPEDLFLTTTIRRANSRIVGMENPIQVTFHSLFLGKVNSLLSIMQENFPELGIRREDCSEMSWIQSVLFFAQFPNGTSPDALLSRVPSYIPLYHFKATSDYVQAPIPKDGIKGIWEFFFENEADLAFMAGTPYGGKMKKIPESAIPFPHRAGNLYGIMPMVQWNDSSLIIEIEKYIDWSRRLYKYLTPYVSSNPRAAYYNYRDLDLGINNQSNPSYAQASIWGTKYYKDNFERLARIKTKVDPTDFFKNVQSIPPIKFKIHD